MKKNSTLAKILYEVNTKYGAPMGRSNVIPQQYKIIDIGSPHKFLSTGDPRDATKRIFDCKVPMIDGGYDVGGAYWGTGDELRVSYTKDLSYINFYRQEQMLCAYFNFLMNGLELSANCVRDCSGPGDAEEAVTRWVRDPAIAEQLDKYSPDDIRKELKQYGAWDSEELADDQRNRIRLLWQAACDISERSDDDDDK